MTMSIESAKNFLAKLQEDAKLAKMIMSAKDDALRLSIAQGAGYNFTLEELEAVRDELNDVELDEVAGGLNEFPPQGEVGKKDSFPYQPATGDGSAWMASGMRDTHQKDEGF